MVEVHPPKVFDGMTLNTIDFAELPAVGVDLGVARRAVRPFEAKHNSRTRRGTLGMTGRRCLCRVTCFTKHRLVSARQRKIRAFVQAKVEGAWAPPALGMAPATVRPVLSLCKVAFVIVHVARHAPPINPGRVVPGRAVALPRYRSGVGPLCLDVAGSVTTGALRFRVGTVQHKPGCSVVKRCLDPSRRNAGPAGC